MNRLMRHKPPDEVGDADNADALILAQAQQGGIASDDVARACGNGAFEHSVVIRIFGDSVNRAGRVYERHYFGEAQQLPLAVSPMSTRIFLPEYAALHSATLGKYRAGTASVGQQ